MKEQSKVYNGTKRLTNVLFLIYLIAISWILLFKMGVRFSYMEKRSINLIPFNEASILNSETILNLLIFIPMGIYTGILFRRWTSGKTLLFLILLSSIIEGLQYILRIGAFDITDIITNTVGGIIGLVLFKAINKAFNHNARAQRFINIIAATGTILMLLLLVLLKMNMLPVRYQ